MDINLKDPKVISLGVRVVAAAANEDIETLKSLAAEAAGIDPELKNAIESFVADPVKNYMAITTLMIVRGSYAALGGDDGKILNAGGGSGGGTGSGTGSGAGTGNVAVAAPSNSINDAPERFSAQIRQVLQVNPSLKVNSDAGATAAAKFSFDLGDPNLSGPKRIANDGDTYYFATPTAVAYGGSGKFVVRRVEGAFTFKPDSFGGIDPAPGSTKSGYILPKLTFEYVCLEGESHTFDAPTDVMFGNYGAYTLRTNVSGNLLFTTANFGDPIKDVPKAGYALKGGVKGMGAINYKDFLGAAAALNLATPTTGTPTGEGLVNQLRAQGKDQEADQVTAQMNAQAQVQRAAIASQTQTTNPLFQNASNATPATSTVSPTQVVAAGGAAAAGFYLFGPMGALAGALAGWLLGSPSTTTTPPSNNTPGTKL